MSDTLYVGSDLVTDLDDSVDGKVSVTTDSGSKYTFTVSQWDSVQSAIPYEDTAIYFRKWKGTVAKILAILTEEGLQMSELSYIATLIQSSVNENKERAICRLLGVEHQNYLSLQQIDAILKSEENF